MVDHTQCIDHGQTRPNHGRQLFRKAQQLFTRDTTEGAKLWRHLGKGFLFDDIGNDALLL